MAKSVQPQPRSVARHSRFSLRTLFIVSGVIAVPFLLLANLQHSARPEQSVASPMYLVLGVAGVVLAAGVGSALADRAGLFAAAGLAALSWIGAVYLCGLFSKELREVLPVHVLAALTTMAVLAAVVWAKKSPEADDPHDHLLRLLQVKHDVQKSQQSKHQDAVPADPPIQNPKSKIQN
jgi:hypothetical protein